MGAARPPLAELQLLLPGLAEAAPVRDLAEIS